MLVGYRCIESSRYLVRALRPLRYCRPGKAGGAKVKSSPNELPAPWLLTRAASINVTVDIPKLARVPNVSSKGFVALGVCRLCAAQKSETGCRQRCKLKISGGVLDATWRRLRGSEISAYKPVQFGLCNEGILGMCFVGHCPRSSIGLRMRLCATSTGHRFDPKQSFYRDLPWQFGFSRGGSLAAAQARL